MSPEGTQYSGAPRTGLFFRTITAAVNDFAAHGFDSQARLDHWMEEIRRAALATLTPELVVDRELRDLLQRIYAREIERGAILKRHSGIGRFTIEQVKPKLRKELDRRVRASAQLIRLNRTEAVETTLRRFSGWASSIPEGGSDIVAKVDTKDHIRKSLAQLPFEARRVAIDQGHKFVANLHDILAIDGNAIAAEWHSHFRQVGYNARKDHAEMDGHYYVIRGNWASLAGFIKAVDGYTDEIVAAGELPFCRCWKRYIYNLRDLPAEMLTEKGKAALAESRRMAA